MTQFPPSSRQVYTIGHSNHAEQAFLDLLGRHGIEVLVDVRSQPYAKYATWFNVEPLKAALAEAGVRYLFLGRELGGRPDGDEFYDDEGHVLYFRLAEAPLFLRGIERVEKGVETYRVALMCSEEDPAVCHRHLLVSRVLAGRGVQVTHIRGDGRLQTEDELHEQAAPPAETQRLLFDEPEEPAWRSLRSVSPRRRQPSSSES